MPKAKTPRPRGRPPLPDNKRRKPLTIMVDPIDLAWIDGNAIDVPRSRFVGRALQVAREIIPALDARIAEAPPGSRATLRGLRKWVRNRLYPVDDRAKPPPPPTSAGDIPAL